jgi:hypothetical protein
MSAAVVGMAHLPLYANIREFNPAFPLVLAEMPLANALFPIIGNHRELKGSESTYGDHLLI